MGEKYKCLLILSLLLNILIGITGGYFIYTKGGLTYVSNKIKAVVSNSANEEVVINVKSDLFTTYGTRQKEVVFLGDSLTDNNEWQEMFTDKNVINRGISGETSEAILARLGDVVDRQPDKIFVMMGVNDLGQGLSTDSVSENYKTLINQIKGGSPETKIYIQSLLPANNQMVNGVSTSNDDIVALNEKLKTLATEQGLVYIDIHNKLLDENNQLATKYTVDGLHLTKDGYLIWKDVIERYVTE